MGRVVVGVDGSDNSLDALRWAIEEADRRGAELEAVYAWHYPYVGADGFSSGVVFNLEELEREAQASLENALAKACPDEERRAKIVRTVVNDGAGRALIDASKGADLLVVGSRGHGGFVGLLLGSVSTQCVHHSHCPVVVIRPDES